MAKTTEAQIKAIQRYDKQNCINISLKLNKVYDQDILSFLGRSPDPKQTSIKKAIRFYLSFPEEFRMKRQRRNSE